MKASSAAAKKGAKDFKKLASSASIVAVSVLAMGAGGMATMWEAVFADVGVALLAILNAVRLQKMQWN